MDFIYVGERRMRDGAIEVIPKILSIVYKLTDNVDARFTCPPAYLVGRAQ